MFMLMNSNKKQYGKKFELRSLIFCQLFPSLSFNWTMKEILKSVRICPSYCNNETETV